MAAKLISKLSILLGINAAGVTDGANKAAREVRGLKGKVDGAAKGMGAFGNAQALAGRASAGLTARLGAMASGMAAAAAGAAAAAISVGAVTQAMQRIDVLAKTADKLGETTEALAGFQLAAELTGVGGEAAATSLQRMVRRLSEAATGTGAAKKALDELGLSAQQLAQQSPTKAFAAISDAMRGVESQSDRVRLAFALFGREGVGLVNTMALGADGLSKVQAEAERLGLAMDRNAAAKVEQANDAITKFQGALSGIANQLAVAFAPAIQMAADYLTELAVDVGPQLVDTIKSFLPLIEAWIKAWVQTAKVVAGVAKAVGSAVEFIAGLGEQFGDLGRSLYRFASPIAGLAERLGLITPPAKQAESAVESLVATVKRSAVDTDQFLDVESVDEFKDAVESAKQEAEEWARIGERLTDSLKTPFERAKDSVSEAKEALDRGVISWETYERAINAAAESLESMQSASVPTGPMSVGAAVRGTTSGFEQVQRSRESTQQLANALRQAAERDTQRNKLLDRLLGVASKTERNTAGAGIRVNEVRI